jgi:aldose sugar dehydrogenase
VLLRRAATVFLSLLLVGLASPSASAQTAPAELFVVDVMTGLERSWDVAFGSDGTMLVTERPGRIRVTAPGRPARVLTADMADLWVSGETGLMAIETDPSFASNRRFYTCQGTTDGDFTVQVVAWQLDLAAGRATRVADPLVGGIDGSTGRHGGCQLRIDPAGRLRIGTGDAAVGTNPQNPFSLAGKTLRVDRMSGAGVAGNPFFGNPGAGDPRIFTLGHRNVQGLAVHPATGEVWSAEHGTHRDDEINRLVAGANYGWDPVPGYDESTPMTKPGFTAAAWSSGSTTVAISGMTFLRGAEWGAWDGALAVATLKDTSVRLFAVAGSTASQIAQPGQLDDDLGRIRGAELGPDGVLYLTTDNGRGTDRVVAVTPSRLSAKHLSLGGLSSFLGGPTTAEQRLSDGRFRHYAGGSIYWSSPTGAREVHGAIRQAWAGMGWERSVLGYPTTDETGTPDGVGRFNHFQRGSIYWTPGTGAREVHGAIRQAWAGMGWERSALGYPTTDERGTPDGVGRFNHFQRGSIYWTPGTGAHEVRGDIRDAWARSGWERGQLGYPVSDEQPVAGGARSDFQRGSILWDAATRRTTVVLR